MATKLCKTSEIPEGKMKIFDVKGKRVFVTNVNGKFYCCDNTCTHLGGPLGKGLLEKGIVTCPWHGAQFDIRTGKVKRGPAQKDVQTYKLTIKKDDIFVEL